MNKSIRYLFLLILLQTYSFSSKAQFPYVESFRAATAPGITFGGAPSAFLTAAGSSYEGGTPIDPQGNGYLRLTNAAKNQKGYVYSNSNFPSFNGLRAEFEYYIYGGNGADGISFFLFDATANPFTIGGFGGSLGYAQITTTNPVSPGVSKGYLAVGLDEFGNFSNPNEGRQGGSGYKPGSVTLRGKGDGAALTPDNYKWLTTVQTEEKGISLVGNGFGRTPDSTNTGYRRVLMEMEPRPGGGYYVSVKLKRGGSGILQPITIIDRFEYTEPAPPNLRYGFASSTGDQTHFHEVRNVSISVFNDATLAVPTAGNDTQNACSGNQVNINAIANDVTTNTGAAIDPSTIDLDPATAGAQKSRVIDGRGTFTANNDGTVTFSPTSSFSGSVSTTYIVRDSYGKASSIGTITINYTTPSVVANAGPDQFINFNIATPTQTVTLAGNNPGAGSSGTWTQISGPNTASFNSASTNNTTVSNLIGGTYIFRWTVIAAGGCTTTDDVKIDVNRPPVAVDDNFTTTISTDIAIPILDNDTDPDGVTTIDISTVVIKNQPQNGTATADPVTGKVIYRPNNGFLGNDSFTYTIKDIHGLESNIAVVTIKVSLEPIGLNDNANTTTNAQVIIPVIDNDPSRANATVIPNTSPSHGNIFINTDGTVTYIPTTGFSGRDSFTYKIRNNSNVESDPITVLVNVYPKGTEDVENTFTGIPVTVAVKDNDLSKIGTTVIPNLNPTNGTISVDANGAILYTPNPGFSGKDSFTYRLRTADGLDSDPILANINVRPVGTADHGVYTINTPLNIPVKNNDASKTGTTVIIATNPTNGTVITNGEVITYTPNAGFTGTNTFNYILRTADGLESAPITVTVTSVAGIPIGLPDVATTPAGIPVSIPVKANDPSATGTTVVVASQPSNGSVVLNAGVPIYTPANGFSGKDTFTYTLRDGSNIDSAPITVTVNVKPVGTADVASTIAGTPVTSPVKDNDPSKTGTTVIPVASPNGGTITVNPTGTVTYTPLEGFSGKDSYTYLLRTADGIDSDPITVNVTVKPVGTTDNVSTALNTSIAIPVKNNDLSKAATTVLINTTPLHGTVNVSTEGIVTFNPTTGYNGPDTFTYILRTADGVDSDPITVNVNITNRPIGTADEVTTPFNTPITIDVKANDASAATTSVVLVTQSLNGTATLNTSGQVLFTPAATFSGKTTFTYKLRAADNSESDPITVTVNVKPVGTADNATTPINTPVTINLKNNDPSKIGTTPVILSTPGHGVVAIDANGNAVFTPTPGYTGADTFTYKLRTADGIESDPITVGVSITPPIPAPNLTGTIPTGQPLNIAVPLPTGGTTIVVTGPTNGTVTIDPTTGRPIYTSNPGYSGPDSFTYIIRDANGNESSVGIVTITVVKPAKIGVAKALLSNVRSADGTVKLNYLFTLVNLGDIGIDRVSLTDDLAAAFPGRNFSVTRISSSGTLRASTAFNGTTVKEMLLNTSTLAANFKEQVELEVTFAANQVGGSFTNSATASGFSVSNGAATSDISTNGLTPDPNTPGDVTPSAPTPTVILVAQDITLPVTTDQPIVVPIPVPTGGTVIITNPPKNGTITINPTTGQPVYTPNAGYSGPDDFTFIIKDANGNESQPAKVTITVSSPAKIGLAKALIGNVKNSDGSFNLRYQFTLVNYGDAAINNVSLIENLNLAFPNTNYQIIDVSTASTSGLRINQGYNGNATPNLLLATSTLAAKSKQTVTLEIKVVLLNESGTFINFAIARGNSAADGTLVEDQSTNGFNPDPITAGDVSPSVLTTVTLVKETLKIPGGFSPNNDGINDFFVVENAGDQAISLEVFNRWGNRIYKAAKYDNSWNGKTTEGIHIGDDVPAGTYYYIITIGNKDKRVGYITINR